MKTNTFVAVARKRHQEAQASIMESLEMTELEHNALCFEYGVDFLLTLFPPVDKLQEHQLFYKYSQSATFWKWYRTEWYFAQKKWFDISKTFINNPDFIMKVLYQEHMKMKCIESRKLITSFDTWRKL